MPEQPLVEDNQAASGRWTVRSDNKALGGSYLYLPDNDPQAPHTHTWTWDVPVAGSYRVEITWLAPNNSGITTQRYRMAGTSFDIARNGVARGAWVGGRNFELAAGAVTLELSEAFNPGQRLFADAARLIPLAAATEAPEVRYLHSDHLNTPRALTDSTGSVVWRAAYDAFGAATVDADPDGDGTEATLNLRFPGQYFDQESGLHYNYFRTYDPSTGRYLESDPIGLAGGVNTYSYAGVNPITNIDPYGLMEIRAHKIQTGFDREFDSFEFDFDPVDLSKLGLISKTLRRLDRAAAGINLLRPEPMGPRPSLDFKTWLKCLEFDATLQSEFEERFGSNDVIRRVSRKEATEFLDEMWKLYPRQMGSYYLESDKMIEGAVIKASSHRMYR
jgi:RHS repeat-associated protein